MVLFNRKVVHQWKDNAMEHNTASPGFVATTLYDNFDDFIKHYEEMNYWRRFDSLPIQCLVRLSRDDFRKARQVYDWAVRVPVLRQLGGWYREHDDTVVTLSQGGLEQVEAAASRFGQNPAFALTMVEGIFVLERAAGWAEKELKRLQPDLDLDEFRTRQKNDVEIMGRVPWVEELYKNVYEKVSYDLRDYIEARNAAIMYAITGLASGTAPHESEIYRAMRGKLHSRKSAKDQRVTLHEPRKDISISDHNHTIEWVIGRNQKEIPF